MESLLIQSYMFEKEQVKESTGNFTSGGQKQIVLGFVGFHARILLGFAHFFYFFLNMNEDAVLFLNLLHHFQCLY